MPYDAVVVGAGINGLAAALHLAVKGWKVVVIERAATRRRRGQDRAKLPGRVFVTTSTP